MTFNIQQMTWCGFPDYQLFCAKEFSTHTDSRITLITSFLKSQHLKYNLLDKIKLLFKTSMYFSLSDICHTASVILRNGNYKMCSFATNIRTFKNNFIVHFSFTTHNMCTVKPNDDAISTGWGRLYFFLDENESKKCISNFIIPITGSDIV